MAEITDHTTIRHFYKEISFSLKTYDACWVNQVKHFLKIVYMIVTISLYRCIQHNEQGRDSLEKEMK